MGCSSSRVESELASKSDLQALEGNAPHNYSQKSRTSITDSSDKSPIERISWRKGDLIGTGANGRVYLGLEEDTGAIIAVKEIMFAAATE